MRTVFSPILLAILLALFVGVSGAAQAQEGSTLAPGDRQSILTVIQSQLDAFARDDGTEAFSYAAPVIRNKFENPDIFMRMVRSGYPQVYRPQSIEFLGQKLSGDMILQAVHLVGPEGLGVVAIYTMERQSDGSWRIAGVQLVPVEDVTS